MDVIRRQMASSALFNITSLVAAMNQNVENSGNNAKYLYYTAVFRFKANFTIMLHRCCFWDRPDRGPRNARQALLDQNLQG